MLVTADHYPGEATPAMRGALIYLEALQREGMGHPLAGAVALPDPGSPNADEPKAYAYISDNRWVVDCPWDTGATLTSPDDPRFFCPYCLNAAVDGQFIEVMWPSPALIDEAMVWLEQRPPIARNWVPPDVPDDVALAQQQTPDDLKQENVDNGVES